MSARPTRRTRPVRRTQTLIVGAAVLVLIPGCDADPLEVSTDVVTPESAANAAGAEALRLAAVNRLAQMLGGVGTGTIGLIPISGLLADEFVVSSQRPGLEAVDRRIVDDVNEGTYATTPYERLSQLRLYTRQAIEGLQAFSPERTPEIAQMFALRSFAETLLGEHFCSGITLSEIDDGRPVFGAPLTTGEVFSRALAHADSAVSYAGADPIGHLARLARARALLNQGRLEDAATDAAQVPTEYIYHVEYTSADNGLANGLTVWINLIRAVSVAESKGGNGLPYVTGGDPRVVVTLGGIGQDGLTEAWVAEKYAALDAPVVLASGIEARLIAAEAALQAGDVDGMLASLNHLRATVSGLDPLDDPGAPDARLDLVFDERAYWLFATAHRLGDLRRLVRQYGRDEASVFPTGEYFKGGEFGPEVNLPIPLSEANNPLYVGCLNRDA